MEWIAINQVRPKTGPIHRRQEEKARRPHQAQPRPQGGERVGQ